MAKFVHHFRRLCTPAFLYFVLSFLAVVVVLFQNIGIGAAANMYRVGRFACRVPNTMLLFAIKVVYILFWTWILNLICRDGHTWIAWFLILIPFLLMFAMMGLVVLNSPRI